MPRLGSRQIAVLAEAAAEVVLACPWLPIAGARRQVEALQRRGLIGATEDLFGIMPAGCFALRHHDRDLARRALAGLRRERAAGSVMPWNV